jgi:hypothetical protein
MSLETFVSKLPAEIGREIFQFLLPPSTVIPDSNEIEYYKGFPSFDDAYNSRYETAFIDDARVENSEGAFLSRISKPNGKHRYYISQSNEVLTNQEEMRMDHRAGPEYVRYYKSRYVGHNMDLAILALLTE